MRCSLFVTGDEKGQLDIWDLLLNHRKPINSLKFLYPIMWVKFRPDGAYLAIGLQNGDTKIFQMDASLKHSSSKDKAYTAAVSQPLNPCMAMIGAFCYVSVFFFFGVNFVHPIAVRA